MSYSFRPHDPPGICARCGSKFHVSQLQKEWSGARVCRGPGTNDCYDVRNPQDFVRGIRDRQQVPGGAAPEPADVFVNAVNTTPNPTPDFYADSSAPGGGNGSLASPFNTVAALTAAMSTGKWGQLTGTFRETLTVPANNNTFSGTATILGSTALTSWTTEATTAYENFLDGTGSTPIAYWPFLTDYSDGKAVANLTQNGSVPISPSGGPPFSTSMLSFSSNAANYLSRTDANLPAGFPSKNGGAAASFTVGAWVVCNTIGAGQNIMAKNGGDWTLFEGTSRLRFLVAQSNGTSKIAIADADNVNGVLHFVVGRYDVSTGEVALFVDGVKQATTATTNLTQQAGTGDFLVGTGPQGNWNGLIGGEPFVFTSALTTQQISDLYNRGLGGAVAGSIYYATLAADPTEQVFLDDSRIPLAPTKPALVSGFYWYDLPDLRLYVADNPATHAIEVSSRNDGIVMDGRTGTVIDGLTVKNQARYGIEGSGGCTGAVVKNCTVKNTGDDSIRFGDGGAQIATINSGIIVDNNTVSYGRSNGIEALNLVTGMQITGNTVHHNCQSAILSDPYTAGIRLLGGFSGSPESATHRPNNVLVSGNNVYSNGRGSAEAALVSLPSGHGIWMDTVGLGCRVTANTCTQNTAYQVNLEWASDLGASTDLECDNNTCSGDGTNPLKGGGIQLSRRSSGVQVHDNSIDCFGTGLNMIGDYLGELAAYGYSRNKVFNNTVTAKSAVRLRAIYGAENAFSQTGNEYYSNHMGAAATGMFQWGNGDASGVGTAYDTYATVAAASGGAFHDNAV